MTLDVMNIIQTAGSILIPVVAWGFKVYSDKQRLEMEAMISHNRETLMDAINKTKNEIAESIACIRLDINKNMEINKRQDVEIHRAEKDIETIRKKVFNGDK